MVFFATSSRKVSRMAFAAALMGAGALGITAVEAPATAQEQPEIKLSKGFSKTFGPINEKLRAENPDYAALRDLLIASDVRESVRNDDDRLVYGSAIYDTGRQLKDLSLQRTGLELMLESGKVAEANVPQYNFVAGTIAYELKDYAAARTYLEKAATAGYEAETARTFIAQADALENHEAGSIGFYDTLIQQSVDAGTKPTDDLLKQAIRAAYRDKQYEPVTKYSILRARYYPSAESWGDAIAVQRNFTRFSEAEILDMLRLSRAAGAMRTRDDYETYIEAAGRRLPAEVQSVAQEGISAGILTRSDGFVATALNESDGRAQVVRDDLPNLASEARASSADAQDAILAGDAYLNFDRGAEAAELYELALTRPGVDRDLALTRLGIAQTKAGNYSAAKDNFAKVQGNRQAIARLWTLYIEQEAAGGATSAS